MVIGWLAAAAACGGGTSSEGLLEPTPVHFDEQEREVSFDEVVEATSPISSITDRRRLLIRDSGAWSDFWTALYSNLAPVPDLPEVDFGSHVVVAATMGERSTGGYSIHIDKVLRAGEDLRVVVIETSPGPKCQTTQSFTAPATAITVSGSARDIEFVEQAVTEDC